ncbi:hypothetical protein [Streptomyces purpurogeneiscleroticus]|uniref:hypothetical protein n=1 Tax=Streptomyces purpurogeneiscleroticus TaxID=68259 RepID=UPI001CC07F36|nr:hypothetical protein [Streptomyces purpurogeneiscleroticus]MBZ4016587.1 hypothetical protein [Streptomyces purpurogeneiscleroticus]
MPVRSLQFLFRLSIIAFLAGGLVIVTGQALGIALGDAGWVAAVEEDAGPSTFISAGISGLLAFVLSYLKDEKTGAPAAHPAPQSAAGPGPQ